MNNMKFENILFEIYQEEKNKKLNKFNDSIGIIKIRIDNEKLILIEYSSYWQANTFANLNELKKAIYGDWEQWIRKIEILEE